MLRTTTLALVLVMFPTLAGAQTTTYRDWMGRETGTATTDRGVTTYRDRMGREVGTSQQRPETQKEPRRAGDARRGR